jgi:hypothetical protein
MNFENLTYKRKNQLLWIGTIVFLLFVYNTVLSKTIDLYVNHGKLSQNVKDGTIAPEKKKNLQAQMEFFNNSLNKYFSDSLKNREYILGLVSEFCNKHSLLLKEFPETTIDFEKDFEIETNVLVAEGNFIDLLKLVYYLEQEAKVARPASVNFEKKFDFRRKKDVLTVSIFLQNIRMNKNESIG